MSAAVQRSPLGLALGAAAAAIGIWMAWQLLAAGNDALAVGLAASVGLAIYVYLGERTSAWRYLFPGVAAMLAFVAFPLAYTVQIGFTNYSSNNLLTEARARAYLLEQRDFDVASAHAFSVLRGAEGLRLLLAAGDEDPAKPGMERPRLISPPLPAAGATRLTLAPLASNAADGTPLDLREVIALRERLRVLQLALPDGRVLDYAGLREFAAAQPLWREDADGVLVRTEDGVGFRPNRDTGFFEGPGGEALQPGFKVNVGWKNYLRLFGDADIRGPFMSIFVWTVVFAGLTVLFSTAIGMTLAVLLNWEALRFRGLYRTLLFLPYAVPGFISILVFKGLFNQNFGEINAILDALFGVKPAWFADPFLAKLMILVVNTWLGYPYIMVLCTGLIKAIPADLYEASAIAGAGPWTNFRRITVPLIAKPLTPLLISAFAFNFNNFVLISLLTDGRPDYLNTKLPAGTTDILVSYTYRIAFTDAGANFGLAAAISTVIFLLVAVMSLVNLRLTGEQAKR